jgi:hypothetical protein
MKMSYPTVPVLSKTLIGTDANFNGDRGVEFQTDPETIVGEISMVAIIQIASWDDVKDQFHYIISQNNGDNTQPENFLRIRGNGTRVIFECGAWLNGVNHEIGVDLDRNKHIGVELYLVGRYNASVKKWSLSINGEETVSPQVESVGAVAVNNGKWMIATHNFAGKERYFKGQIFYAAVYNLQ